MRSTLRIRLLGGLDLLWEGRPLEPLESIRAQSLLAYLLLNPAPQPRQHLAFVLWPDSTEAQALTNLRHQLHLLRKVLPDPDRFLESTRSTIRWRPDAPYWLDVAALGSLTDPNGSPPELSEVLELYRGDLLAGSYDEWLVPHRQRLRTAFIDALGRIAEHAVQQGRTGQAIAAAEQLILHDPLREDVYRMLMRLHFERGDRAKALRTFHECTEVLEQELGVGPAPATHRVYEQLIGGEDAPEARSPAGLAAPPLVGRTEALEALTAAWEGSARQSQGLVLITGEAGIGKTRLVDELAAWCSRRSAVVTTARGYPAEGSLAYGLVTAWLRSAVYRGYLAGADHGLKQELSRLLPELRAGIEPPEPGEAGQLRLFDAVAGALLSPGAPLLLIAEDLHWADRQSLQLVHYLVRLESPTPVLVVGTARTEEVGDAHPLTELLLSLRSRGLLNEIELERLSAEATVALAELVSGAPLPAEEAEAIFAESEGNPLFIVEAARAGIPGKEPASELSPRVQGVIELRLAQLSEPARTLLGVAAAVGREFSPELLRGAAGGGQEDLTALLDELWRRRIVRERGPGAYDFSHYKIREVVYRRLSPVLRRSYHRHIAARLEQLHAARPEGFSHQIATHYDSAAMPAAAARWYELAAGEARAAHADSEALRLLDRGLELVATLADEPERDRLELHLLLALLPPLSLLQGATSSRTQAAQQRAMELSARLGVDLASPLLRSSALSKLSLGDFEEARRLGRMLRARGEEQGDAVLAAESGYVLGIAAFWKGDLQEARRHFEEAVAGYRPEHHLMHRVHYGLDPKVVCLSRLGHTLWFLGEPQRARESMAEALTAADTLGHGASLATAAVFACLLALDERNELELRRRVALLQDPAVNTGSLATQVTGAAFGGYLEVLDGRTHIGIGIIRRALEESEQHRYSPGFTACLLRLLLSGEAIAGRVADGLATADAALRFPDGARLWEPELRRLKADLLDLSGAPAPAVEAELERALQVARRQGSVMLSLRCGTALLEHRLQAGGDVAGALLELQAALGSLDPVADGDDMRRARAALERI